VDRAQHCEGLDVYITYLDERLRVHISEQSGEQLETVQGSLSVHRVILI